jgi:YgiT-type zinc finger domain-containing protein
MVDYTNKTREKAMKDLLNKPCTECGAKLREKLISQEFERQGRKVRLSGIRAWVCSKCGEIYFQPGGATRVTKAANCLFELASTEKQYKGTITAKVS